HEGARAMANRRLDPADLLPDPEPVQLLDPDGNLRAHPDLPLDLSDDLLRDLYRWMVVTRAVDQEAINLQRQGQLAVYASCLGQEAAQVGSAAAIGPDDWVFPSYRELGAATARDVDLVGLMHMFRGTWLSDHDPVEQRFGLMAIPIGTQVLHAVGYAMGTRLDGQSTVTIAYCGDGATSEGDTHEALTFAGVFEAPVVFLVQNNQYAISVPFDRQTAAPSLAHKAVGYGIPGVQCDGNDVLASYLVTRRAVERARAGGGPTFIEALTYRREAHTTSDDARRYRSDEEVAGAAARDPIARMAVFLRGRGLLDDDLQADVDHEAVQRARAIRDAVFDADHGDPMELFDHVYVDATGHLDGQAERLRRELDGA
ncbi:MAG: pyruvate dehydrogenase (acetyl-transferring) E1 component subunit alpha, partial [Nitriliruptoraceae bacterium]